MSEINEYIKAVELTDDEMTAVTGGKAHTYIEGDAG